MIQEKTKKMSKITLDLQFLFDQKNRLFLAITLHHNKKPISLSLATFMQFLYKNNTVLLNNDIEFCYILAKLVKKVDFEGQLIYAIPNDYDMALLIKNANKYKIKLYWKNNDTYQEIKLKDPLPLTIEVTEHKNKLLCHLINHKQ